MIGLVTETGHLVLKMGLTKGSKRALLLFRCEIN